MNRPAVDRAIAVIEATPGYFAIAQRLRSTPIILSSTLTDRAQTTLRGHIILGPEPFANTGDCLFVSLAGTLVHEHFHTRQNPLQKTASFWRGAVTRTHPMRRYEAPAYAAQADFLSHLALSQPALAQCALHERDSVLAAFAAHYGSFPD